MVSNFQHINIDEPDSDQGSLRVVLVQANPCVGDLNGNVELALRQSALAMEQGADVVVFAEMHLTGYPIEDLALRPSFFDAVAAAQTQLAAELLQRGLGELVVVVGTLLAGAQPQGYNAAAILYQGQVQGHYCKQQLPNYGVFDEARYFTPGNTSTVLTVHGMRLGLAICEDIWGANTVVTALAEHQVDALVVLNGSPFEQSKRDDRGLLCAQRARQLRAPVLYVNQIGGQDELLFDGDSLVVAADGEIIARATPWQSAQLHVELSRAAGSAEVSVVAATQDCSSVVSPLEPVAEVYQALVLGLGDYVRKNGFSKVVLGLSGGIDSALVAAIAADACGAQNVIGVAMPSQHSSDHSVADAVQLAENIGLDYRIIPIEPMVQAFNGPLAATGLAAENLQARVRGIILMTISNSEGALVLATSNKSEVAVGYSTIYGDAVGGFAPLKDVLKTLVWQLARWRNQEAQAAGIVPPIPENSITKPPSAELRPDQLDSDSLPDYHLLDQIVTAYVEQDLGSATAANLGAEPAEVDRIVRLIDAAEYKRRQFPPGPKITKRAFGRDRRLPITSRWREHSQPN